MEVPAKKAQGNTLTLAYELSPQKWEPRSTVDPVEPAVRAVAPSLAAPVFGEGVIRAWSPQPHC